MLNHRRMDAVIKVFKPPSFVREVRGGITLEAAIITPMFIAFVLVLILFVRLAVTEIALKSAAAETTKLVSAHLYPVELLVNEAISKYNGSKIGEGINSAIERVEEAQGKLEQVEEFVDDYAAWIPAPFINLIAWEKEMRESAVNQTQEEIEHLNETVLQPKLNQVVTPIVYMFADQSVLEKDRMQVTRVNWPSLTDRDHAYLGIEVSYRFPIRIPFLNTELILKKKAYERVWLGA
ncbi:pilus assembly protein [Paenibacillus albiflavus]|uniref:Pilus assembly protein n=1 Tax=Paenibacillus albiflavus TaxID=2545760 RepID=A0A4R4EL92_9BACL|nr:TadE family protein [Paenibacillus albiflavus]TCZ81014.1 pilus assembly protein [Paenibacillus albiflavus]